MKEVKREPDKGVGDTVARVIKNLGLDRLVKKNDGSTDCVPCQKRQEGLNERFPYRKPSE